MAGDGNRLNVTLDEEYATKLARLAERVHMQEGTLARSLLSQAIDQADVDPGNVVRILDGISGAFDRAQLGLEQARTGRTTGLDDL
jgi:predicted transcriptional regulator